MLFRTDPTLVNGGRGHGLHRSRDDGQANCMMISGNKMYNIGRVPHLRSPCMSNRSSIDMNDYMRNEDGLVQGQLSDEAWRVQLLF